MENLNSGPADIFKREAIETCKKIDTCIENSIYSFQESDIDPSQAMNCCVYLVEVTKSKRDQVLKLQDQQRSLLNELGRLYERLGDVGMARQKVSMANGINQMEVPALTDDTELKNNLEIFRQDGERVRKYAVELFQAMMKCVEEIGAREKFLRNFGHEKGEVMEKLRRKEN